MQSTKYQEILQGHPQTLQPEQLSEFEIFCSIKNLPLEQWIDTSLLLYRLNPEQAYHFLSYLEKYELPKPAYNDYIHQGSKITIYNNLTGLALARATREPSKEDTEKYINQAKKFLNLGQKVRMTVEKSIILNRAFLLFYGGEITKALNFVSRSYQETLKTGEGKNLLVTTTLMLAQIHFTKKNYPKALQLYKKCLQLNKNLPTRARLGMAYCFFNLGKYQMARACFQRIIKLDPSCVEAYVGIAVVNDKDERYEEYFAWISMAYKINRKHPLVLLHVSEHLLLKGQLHKSYELCLTGLSVIEALPKFVKLEEQCRNDYEQFKGRFSNILGQIHHINGNFSEAIKFYNQALGKGLIHNQIALAQVYINPNSQNYLQALKVMEDLYKNNEGKQLRLLNDSYRLIAYLKSKIPPKKKEDKNTEYFYNEALKYNRNDFETKIQYSNILSETNKSKALKQLEEALKIQQNSGQSYKIELENNIAVLLLDSNEPQEAEQSFLRCFKNLKQMETHTEQEELKKAGLTIICNFNYGICLQKLAKFQSALKIYEQNIAINKYHLDTYMRIAYIYYQDGNYSQAINQLQQAQKLCSENKYKLLKPQRIYSLKAYIQHMAGSSSEAKQTIKLFGKNKDIYTQVFQLCIGYETIMRKSVELPVLKDFLRPNRQFCYKYCNEDHNAAFAYMLLTIILIADKKFTKSQALEFFNNLKQFSSDDIPSILYNMGLFLMNYDDYEASNAVLQLYKDKVNSIKGDEILALNSLLQQDYKKSIKSVKKNILRDPSNIRYRLQLVYVTQRRCLKYYDDKIYDKKQVITNLQHLKSCINVHHYFSKMNINQYLKGIQLLEVKQRLKTIFLKIKTCCEERKYYVKSYIQHYEKTFNQLEYKQKERDQIERIKLEKKKNQEKNRELQQLLEQSDDEQERQRKVNELKRQRALELAKKRQAELDQAWRDLQQKEKLVDSTKKSKKKTTPGPRRTGASKRQKIKEKQEESFEEGVDSSKSEKQAVSESPSQEQFTRKKHQKHDKEHREGRQKKKIKKQRSEQDQQDELVKKSDDSKREEDKPKDDFDEDSALRKYLLD